MSGSITYGKFKDSQDSEIIVSSPFDSEGSKKEYVYINCSGSMADESYFPRLDTKGAQLLIDCLKGFIHHSQSSDSGNNNSESWRNMHSQSFDSGNNKSGGFANMNSEECGAIERLMQQT